MAAQKQDGRFSTVVLRTCRRGHALAGPEEGATQEGMGREGGQARCPTGWRVLPPLTALPCAAARIKAARTKTRPSSLSKRMDGASAAALSTHRRLSRPMPLSHMVTSAGGGAPAAASRSPAMPFTRSNSHLTCSTVSTCSGHQKVGVGGCTTCSRPPLGDVSPCRTPPRAAAAGPARFAPGTHRQRTRPCSQCPRQADSPSIHHPLKPKPGNPSPWAPQAHLAARRPSAPP